ncbi:MAG: hypothetical protein ACOC6P_02420 [Candidatus Aminicenantaceae bacterium]
MYYQKSVEQERAGSPIGYYQGLSYLKLGMKQDAQRMFDSLREQAENTLQTSREVEFFVKFGEKQSATKKSPGSLSSCFSLPGRRKNRESRG